MIRNYVDSDSTFLRIKRFVNSLRPSITDDIRTPLWDELPRRYIHEDFVDRYGTTSYELLNELEDQETPVSPMSLRESWNDRKPKLVDSFFNEKQFAPDRMALSQAFTIVRNRIGRLRPLSLDNAFKSIPRKTNTGLPMFVSDPEVLQYYYEEAKQILQGKLSGRYPYILSTRTQASRGWDSRGKTRDIWIAPKARVIIDAMFSTPIVARLSQTPTNAAWQGPEAVNDVMTHVMSLPGSKYSSDIDGFDASVHYELFVMLYELKVDVFGEQYRQLLEESRDHISLDGIVTPDGWLDGRVGGLASGNGNTSVDGTLIQEVAHHYSAIRLGIHHRHLSVMGDDGVSVYDAEPDVEEIQAVMSELGFTFNAEKQYVSDRAVHYLQNLHLQDYQVNGRNVGVRSVHRMINRASSLERVGQFPSKIASGMMSIRALMQFNTCKYHPQFTSAVEYLLSGDRLLQENDPVDILRSVGTSNAESALRQSSFNREVDRARDLPGLPIVSVVRDLKERVSSFR
jgi:hypothetical protein